MSYPILYETNATDFFNLGLGTLPDAISPLVTEERNGEFVFDMSYPIDGRRADLIKNNRIIKVDAGHLLKDQRFVIKTVTPQMDNSGKTFLMIHAEHVSYLANDLAIKPIVNGIDVNASQALSIWNSNLTTPNQFIVDSDINSKNSFSWSIDKVQNGRQALGGVEGSILDHWHGEYRFDNLHISLLQHRGTIANTLLAYGRNLTTFEQEESIMETYTSVYPYALLTPAGSDSESKIYTIDGLIIDSTHAANFPNRKVLPVDFSSQFENVKVGTKPSGDDADKTSTYLSLAQVQSKLKEFAQSYITTNNVGVPKVSIKVSFVDLANTVNYADVAPLEELDLCDEVPIRFSKLGIDTTAKVSRVVWNVLTDSYDSLELGEISATLGDKLTEIEQTANKAQDTADKANIVQVGADGKSTIFRGSDTPIANHVGDLWYKPNGEYMEMYQWDGVTWHFVMSTKDTHDISDKVDQAMQEMADKVAEIDAANNNSAQALEAANTAQQTAQEAANSVNSALNDVATAKQNASDALTNANQAAANAATALSTAKTANDATKTLKTDIDTINGTLKLTATKSEVNAVSNSVQSIQGDIDSINGSLKLVATKTEVDTVNQRVTTVNNSVTANTNALKLTAKQTDVDALTKRVTTTESGLNTVNGQLDGFVKKTVVDALTKRVSTNELAIKANSDALELTAKQSDVNSLTGRIGTAENSIKVNAKAIEGKASASSVNELTGDLTTAKSQWKASADGFTANILNVNTSIDKSNKAIQANKASIDATAKELKVNYTTTTDEHNWVNNQITVASDKFQVSINSVNDKLGSLATGGQNLVPNSGDPQDVSGWSTVGNSAANSLNVVKHSLFKNGTRNMFIIRNSSATKEFYIILSSPIQVQQNRDYTLSFDVFSNGNMAGADVYIIGDNGTNKLINNKKWIVPSAVRESITFNSGQMQKLQVRFDNNASQVEGADGDLFIGDVTLVQGNVPQAWSPPITDLATQANLKVVSDQIDLMVKKNDVINRINVSSEGVLIQGNRVHITGQTTIDNAVIKSSMIDTLDASKITAGTLNAANVNIINMNVSKLVGDTTNFVQSAWNGISGNIYIDSSSINVIGDWGANTLDSWGIRSYAYNANHNLELVGNFSSTYAVGNKNINGTLVSADYEGDFVGIGYRNKVGDNFTPMVGYFKQDQTALGWYQGTNIIGHLILHDYIKPLGGTGDYIQVGTINFNNIKYAYIGNSSGKAGFAYGSGYMYLISQGSAYRMAGWKIPIDIASDGKVKTWIELPGSAS